MNVPAIAKKTFDTHQGQKEYSNIINKVLNRISKIINKVHRAYFIHQLVDEYNQEVFEHPLVQQYSPCKIGCSACCHTQVSVTEDEAALLVQRIHEGVAIDENLLRLQMAAKDDSEAYYKIPYQQRRCIFLDEQGGCRVYEDRPSVCRTNAVLGESSQCDTSQGMQPTRLIKTTKADFVIYASFLASKENGTLPHMVGKLLGISKQI